MVKEINNSEDILDSRDIIARIDELESERETLVDNVSDADEGITESENKEESQTAFDEAKASLKEFDEGDEGEELKTLKALQDEAEGYADDWKHGVTLIRDSYFETYAQEFAEDIGAIDSNASWPNTCIDWEQAARELQQDYTSVEFGDVTYWVR